MPSGDGRMASHLLAAQATGLPVVVGDAGGVPAIIRHGETGRIVTVGDAAFSQAGANSVAELLAAAMARRQEDRP